MYVCVGLFEKPVSLLCRLEEVIFRISLDVKDHTDVNVLNDLFVDEREAEVLLLLPSVKLLMFSKSINTLLCHVQGRVLVSLTWKTTYYFTSAYYVFTFGCTYSTLNVAVMCNTPAFVALFFCFFLWTII